MNRIPTGDKGGDDDSSKKELESSMERGHELHDIRSSQSRDDTNFAISPKKIYGWKIFLNFIITSLVF